MSCCCSFPPGVVYVDSVDECGEDSHLPRTEECDSHWAVTYAKTDTEPEAETHYETEATDRSMREIQRPARWQMQRRKRRRQRQTLRQRQTQRQRHQLSQTGRRRERDRVKSRGTKEAEETCWVESLDALGPLHFHGFSLSHFRRMRHRHVCHELQVTDATDVA